jgi:hypothetical protein
MLKQPVNGMPITEPIIVRGAVEEVTDQGLRVGGRWFVYGAGRPWPAPAIGHIVQLDVQAGVVHHLAVLAAPVTSTKY